jgi:hypothetical protein
VRNYKRNRDVGERYSDLRPERIDDHGHQRRHGSDYGREEVDESRRFIGNDVFLENELQQIRERLQDAAVSDTIWTKPALNEAEYTSLRKDCVRDYQQHHHERHSDGRKLESYIDRSIHQTVSATDFKDVI